MTRRAKQSDLRGLEALALTQGGYFNAADARAQGMGKHLISYHIGTGRFERIYPGVYRLAIAPMAPHDQLLLAWVWSAKRGCISHESALELYGLSDVLPSRVHLTVPPTFARGAPGYTLHRADLAPEEVTEYDGLPATTPARTIVDAAAAGTGPDQIEAAVRQALARGLVTAGQLREATARRGYRWRRIVQPMIEEFVRRAAA